jgi:hypothetical protein
MNADALFLSWCDTPGLPVKVKQKIMPLKKNNRKIPHGTGDLYAVQFVVSVFIRFRGLARTQAEFFIMASVIEFTKLIKKFQPSGNMSIVDEKVIFLTIPFFS